MPKNVSGPVVRGADLYGRRGDVDALWRLVEASSVLLTGPRRHGKTSLQYALFDDPQPGWTVANVDVEYIDHPAEFLTTVAAELLRHQPLQRTLTAAADLPSVLGRWLRAAISEVGAGVPDVAQVRLVLRDALPPIDSWPELAEQLLVQLGRIDGDLLIIVDEFPMMVDNMLDRSAPDGLRFLKWFRALRRRTHEQGLRFLLGGSINILPRLEAMGCEALLNDLDIYRLRPFDSAVALSFVMALLDSEGAECEDGVAQQVVAVTGSGVPFYLQVLVGELLSEARRTGEPVRVDDVARIYALRVVGPENRHRFSHYHSRLREHYGPYELGARVVLGALARADGSTPEALRHALFVADIDSSDLEALLVMLEGDYYIVVEDGHWRFSDGLLRDWWRRNAPGARGTGR